MGVPSPCFLSEQLPLRASTHWAEGAQESIDQYSGVEPGLIMNEYGKAGGERRPSSRELGAALYYEGLSWQRSMMKRQFSLVQTVLFDGRCERMFRILGEPGIKYLLLEEIPRKGSLLAECSGPI